MRTALCTDLREEAGAIEVPTLILHGDADASAPVALCGRRLAGHGIFVTHADAVSPDLLDFVGGAWGGWGPGRPAPSGRVAPSATPVPLLPPRPSRHTRPARPGRHARVT
ncbi:alpha/beta fold hydrolase [Streptomyces sp. KL118A]|uniref:alpha/beta fold hydrolase n=1 Tax=Streptomyces sp. KL118A TaxID=3045153 RepID=UPI00278C54A2|nr:hypothetical protein [Streptomyces sp. KL118A]